MKEKVLGILGGMGPEATITLFKRIVDLSRASCDQEHIRIIIDNNPKILDRTNFILNQGESPAAMMIATAQNLERAGADFIVIPCVTAHYFAHQVQQAIAIPILSIIDALISEIVKNYPSIEKLGLVATTGTIIGSHLEKGLQDAGYKIIVPSDNEQKSLVMKAIYGERGIKAGFLSPQNKNMLLKASQRLIALGAQGIIAGCTEIPLVLTEKDLSVPFLDTLLILAKEAVKKVKSEDSLFEDEKVLL